MRMDARRLDDMFSFDQVLLDAPCSGSGTLSLDDPKMPRRFTSTLIERCVRTQEALLSKAMRLVKPGGTVVYSTCSVLREEDEEIIKRVQNKQRIRVLPIDMDRLRLQDVPLLPVSIDGTLRICPTSGYEGFFIAKLQRL